MSRVQLYILIIALSLCGCNTSGSTTSNLPNIPVRNFLVDSKSYPPGWIQLPDSIRSYPEDDDIENIHVSYVLKSDRNIVSLHEVKRYTSLEYVAPNEVWRPDGIIDNSLSNEIKSKSSIKNLIVKCGMISTYDMKKELCDSYVQYGNYFSRFSSYIGANAMSVQSFVDILAKIDKIFDSVKIILSLVQYILHS